MVGNGFGGGFGKKMAKRGCFCLKKGRWECRCRERGVGVFYSERSILGGMFLLLRIYYMDW